MLSAAAGDHQLGGGQGCIQLVLGDRTDVVAGGELLGPATGGVDRQLGAAAAQKGGDDHPGVAAGADQQHSASGQREVAGLDQVQADLGQGASGLTEPALAGDSLCRGQGRIEEPVQSRAGPGAGLSQGAPDLADDLGLADHHRVQAAGHFEQVLDGGVRGVHLELIDQVPIGGCQRLADRGEDQFQAAVEGLGFGVQLEAIAGVQQDASGDVGPIESGQDLLGSDAQPGQLVQGY